MIELGQSAPAADDVIKDVTEATFMADVVEASSTVPVVVDFWAPWCGPCKALGPVIENAVKAQGGKVKLAKVNVDENQMIAAQMRIQSIPAVYAFIDGQPVDGFVGNKTPAEIEAFVEHLGRQASGEDAMLENALAQAQAFLDQGAAAEAAEIYGGILSQDAKVVEAYAGMVESYLLLGDTEQASSFLQNVPANLQDAPEIIAVRAKVDLAGDRPEAGEIAELRRRIDSDAGDLQARLDLGKALMAENRSEDAIEELLELFRRDREWNEGAAKAQLITIFDALGPKDPLVQKGRRKLSSMIFA